MLENRPAAGRVPSPRMFVALFAACALSACVQSRAEKMDTNSGETHFLRSCEDSCPNGLSCICGVCTKECQGDQSCRGLAAAATCVRPNQDRCDLERDTNTCEVSCLADADCRVIGAKHRCTEGVCRASPALDETRDAALTDAAQGAVDGGAVIACGAKSCGPGQRCCDRCLGSCVAEAAELACPDELWPDRSCSDAGDADAARGDADTGNPLACGSRTCQVGQRCCDRCRGLCVPASADIACPDESDPARTCGDASIDACAASEQSCLASACCDGLTCCEGIPIPAGEAYCYTTCPRSDYNVKTDFAAVDSQAVLARVLALPISSWRYRDEPQGISHIGPMAQDFKASFGVGSDDKHIFPLDEGGVSLAAIQALHKQLTSLAHEQRALRSENGRLRAELEQLRRRVSP